MTTGERIYKHGVMSLVCVVLVFLSYLTSRYIFQPTVLFCLFFATLTGYHIGMVAKLSAKKE